MRRLVELKFNNQIIILKQMVLVMHIPYQVVVLLTFIKPIYVRQETSLEKSEVLGEQFFYINNTKSRWLICLVNKNQ